ncbi:MAG: hypothetical protein RL026_2022 [Pseudomonadota bacterium]
MSAAPSGIDGPTLLAILGMAAGAFLTRAGGYWLYKRFRPGEALQQALSYIPGGLFISFVVPAVAQGGPKEWLGAVVAAVTMKLTGSVTWPIFTGTAAAWLWWVLAGT